MLRAQREYQQLLQERDRMLEERNQAAAEHHAAEAERLRSDANALQIRVDTLQDARQQEEANFVQARADALAEQYRLARIRADVDRVRALAQSPPTGFQQAYVKSIGAYSSSWRPPLHPPSTRFVQPFSSVSSVTQVRNPTSPSGAGVVSTAATPNRGSASGVAVPATSTTPNLGSASGGGVAATSATVNLGVAIGNGAGTAPTAALAAPAVNRSSVPYASVPVPTTAVQQNQQQLLDRSTYHGGRPQTLFPETRLLDGQPQTSTQLVATASGLALPPPQNYLAAPTPASGPGPATAVQDADDQELQQVINLSKAEDDYRAAQDRVIALRTDVAVRGLTANLGVRPTPAVAVMTQPVPQLNPYAQQFVPTAAPWQPWSMPGGYVTSPFVAQTPWQHSYAAVPGAGQANYTSIPATVPTSTPGLPPTSSSGGGVNGPGQPPSGQGGGNRGPPDPDPDDDPPDKKKRNKEIDSKRKGEFQIDSAFLKTAKSRPRGNMRCEVERFERGTDLTIKDWVNQMETYFTIGQIPSEAFVGFMLMKIAAKHLNEIKQYQSLDYLEFREKLVEVFEEPDLATAYLNALSSISQDRDESISDYMQRVRLLVLKAHPKLDNASRERILITSFMLGLHDKQLAANLAVVKVQSAAEAERLAAEGEAVRRDQRAKRTGNYSLPERIDEEESENEDVGEPYPDEEEEEELAAALTDFKSGKRGTSTSGQKYERRKATSSTKCYNCGNFGHYASDCPRRDRSTSRRNRKFDQRPIACLLCGGDHLARDCPQLEIAKRAVSNSEKATKADLKSTSSRPSTPGDQKDAFKKDGTAVICEAHSSPIRILDPALPAMSEESTPGTPRMQLFFVLSISTDPAGVDIGGFGLSAEPDRRERLQEAAVPTPDTTSRRCEGDRRKRRSSRFAGVHSSASVHRLDIAVA